MKRAKKLVTLLTIASLTLGSAVTAFGASVATSKDDAAEVVQEESTDVVKTETQEVIEDEVTYPDLAFTTQTYVTDTRLDIGQYPVITGMDKLNAAIFNCVFHNYTYYINDNSNAQDGNNFTLGYAIDNVDQYAKITISMSFNTSTVNSIPHVDETFFYVDKATMKEMTAEEFDFLTDPDEEFAIEIADAIEEAAKEDAAKDTKKDEVRESAEDIIMVPLRLYVEELGYTIGWDKATSSVTVLSGKDVVTKLSVGKNEYTVAGVLTKLDAAPVMEDEVVWVPASFFEEVLGATIGVDDEGYIIFTLPADTIVVDEETDDEIEA